MKPENKILLIAILYSFLGIGTILFANWSVNYFEPSPFFAVLVFLIAITYNGFLAFYSFPRCWNIVINSKQNDAKEGGGESEWKLRTFGII